ncbi:hypothetical protein EYC51_09190 [Alcaligenes faecalis]|nr:hypothetical protein EYC51_09190 [Alcaligenes faecalis]
MERLSLTADSAWQFSSLASLGWVAWFNHKRLHSSIGYIPPAEGRKFTTMGFGRTCSKFSTPVQLSSRAKK